jgi:MoaA/NifB/PqqE/SkfB family radical SAM enzyme
MDSSQLRSKIENNRKVRRLFDGEPLCLAPTAGIFFRNDGTASACYANNEQSFGKYPQQSVQEIWQSAERQALRDNLQKNILPSGCSACTENILNGSHDSLLACRYDNLRSTAFKKNALKNEITPLTVEFELGTICNYECVMCNEELSSSIRKNRCGLPPKASPYDDNFVEQCRPYVANLENAFFVGGEPFLNQLNFKMWSMIAEENPRTNIFITTNGSILTDKVKSIIKSTRPRVTVSLESLQKHTYEKIRVNGQLEHMLDNLKWLHANGFLFGINVCPLRSNWQDIPEIVTYANQLHTNVWYNLVVEPKEHSLKYASQSELDTIITYLSSIDIGRASPLESNKQQLNTIEKNMIRYRRLIGLISDWRNATAALQ